MNRKQYTEEELKELMEAPPTEEEMEILKRYCSHISIKELITHG
ncbi:hypothetical protein [Mangrovibacillus cuniculi]|nr:hypothetical protein [Mangrovibacillus cuniculi]